MSQQKLTIVPVTLHAENKDLDTSISPTTLSNSICMIKTANAEISFFNGVDESTIQTVMRELNRVHYVVVAGRRKDFNETTYQLKRQKKLSENILLLHYDNLYDSVKALIGESTY